MSRYLLIPFFFLIGCAPVEVFYPSEALARLEIGNVVQMGETYDIRLDQSSTVYNPNIGTLCLRYTSEEIFDMCQAREMLVDLVDSLLMQINENIPIQISNGPLTPDRLDLVITYDTFFGEYCDEQYVNQVRLQGGEVTFFAFTAFDCQYDYFEKHCEPYRTSQINVTAYRDAYEQFPTERTRLTYSNTPVVDVISGFQVPESALRGALPAIPKRTVTAKSTTPRGPTPTFSTSTSSFGSSSSIGTNTGATGSRTPNTGY